MEGSCVADGTPGTEVLWTPWFYTGAVNGLLLSDTVEGEAF